MERRDVALTNLNALGGRANLVDNTTEFVTENVTCGKLDDSAVKKMEI